jgi:superfamily I DNA/RNA helicase
METYLFIHKIPYSLSSKITKFFEKKEVKKVLYHLQLLVSNEDNFAMEQVLRDITGVGDKTVHFIKNMG